MTSMIVAHDRQPMISYSYLVVTTWNFQGHRPFRRLLRTIGFDFSMAFLL